MSWSQHLRSAQEFLKVGDDVEAVILTLDRDERKMSLGIKQLKEDPWEAIEVKYPVGSKHTAKVRNFTNFGVFVELEEGVDGLIHISDLSWTKKVKHLSTPLVLSTMVRLSSCSKRVLSFHLTRMLRASLLLSISLRKMAHRLSSMRFCPSRLLSSIRIQSASSCLTAAPLRILSVRRRRLLPRRHALSRRTILQRLRTLQQAPLSVTSTYWPI